MSRHPDSSPSGAQLIKARIKVLNLILNGLDDEDSRLKNTLLNRPLAFLGAQDKTGAQKACGTIVLEYDEKESDKPIKIEFTFFEGEDTEINAAIVANRLLQEICNVEALHKKFFDFTQAFQDEYYEHLLAISVIRLEEAKDQDVARDVEISIEAQPQISQLIKMASKASLTSSGESSEADSDQNSSVAKPSISDKKSSTTKPSSPFKTSTLPSLPSPLREMANYASQASSKASPTDIAEEAPRKTASTTPSQKRETTDSGLWKRTLIKNATKLNNDSPRTPD